MNEAGFAARYAEAYLGAGALDLALKSAEVSEFLTLLEKSTELFQLLSSSNFTFAEKEKVLRQLKEKGELSEIFLNFLLVILSNGRAFYLRNILEEFIAEADLRRGIVSGYCYTAFKLEVEQREALIAKLQKKFRSQVKLKFILDPDLIGGVRIAIGGTRIDGSLRAVSEKLRRQLLERR